VKRNTVRGDVSSINLNPSRGSSTVHGSIKATCLFRKTKPSYDCRAMATWIGAQILGPRNRGVGHPASVRAWIPLILSLPSLACAKSVFVAVSRQLRRAVAPPLLYRLRGACQLEIGGDETRSYEGLVLRNKQYV
jgi:hypothetical protein